MSAPDIFLSYNREDHALFYGRKVGGYRHMRFADRAVHNSMTSAHGKRQLPRSNGSPNPSLTHLHLRATAVP